MSLTSSEMTPADIAAVTNGGGNRGGGGFGWGNDGAWWIIVLFLFAAMNGGWGNNNGGNGGGFGGGGMPYILNAGTNADIQRGFDQQAIMASLNGLTTGQCNQTATLQNAITQGQIANMQGFNGIQNQLCNCCNDVGRDLNAGVNLLQNTMMQNEMNRQNCCCENRAAIADLKYTIATENCADRQALSDGVRDILAGQNAGIQRILDTMCQDKIDAKNDEIARLRQEVYMKDLTASQIAQTAQLQRGQNEEVDALYNRLRNCPVPSMPVYGMTPIFTCPQNQNNFGCGCGCGA